MNYINKCLLFLLVSVSFISIAQKKVDTKSCSMLKKSGSSEGNWKEADLKESGLKTREFLRKQNSKN